MFYELDNYKNTYLTTIYGLDPYLNIASVFFDILSYTIGNNILCIFKNFELNLII